MKQMVWIAIAAIALAAPAAGQNVVTAQNPKTTVSADLAKVTQDQVAATLKAKMEQAFVQARITRGAPYSAETTSESIQVLANGTRIINRSGTRVYRDNDGRTRTEHVNEAGEIVSITISDPVQGASYMLDPKSHIAYQTFVITLDKMATADAKKLSASSEAALVAAKKALADAQASGDANAIAAAKRALEAAQAGNVTFSVSYSTDGNGAVAAMKKSVEATQGGASGFVVSSGGQSGTAVVTTMTTRVDNEGLARPTTDNTTREDLGHQVIEGVDAAGTRITTLLPVGAIGNDQPIQIVSEQWFSPELQVLVLTRHSDPRVGDTTYRLTGIVRANQAQAFFEVPGDYQLQQNGIRKNQEPQ